MSSQDSGSTVLEICCDSSLYLQGPVCQQYQRIPNQSLMEIIHNSSVPIFQTFLSIKIPTRSCQKKVLTVHNSCVQLLISTSARTTQHCRGLCQDFTFHHTETNSLFPRSQTAVQLIHSDFCRTLGYRALPDGTEVQGSITPSSLQFLKTHTFLIGHEVHSNSIYVFRNSSS